MAKKNTDHPKPDPPKMEFNLSSPAGGELEIVVNAPPELLPCRLPAFQTDMVKGRFGSLFFHHYKGDGFDIWYSNYRIKHTTVIKGRADMPVLELHTAVKNNFKSSWDGIGLPSSKEKQYNMSFTPHVHNKAEFIGGLNYETCDFHFSTDLLQKYSPFYPSLDKFLNKVEKKIPCSLLTEDTILSLKMSERINEILANDNHPGVASFFYDSKVKDILIMLLERENKRNRITPAIFSSYEIDCTKNAEKFLLSDFRNYPSIKKLSLKVGLNECTLKKSFKHQFGDTIFDYFMIAKMAVAKKLLLDLQYPVQEIAEMVGYPDKSNFYAAFKNYFGITPGQWCLENNINRKEVRNTGEKGTAKK